MISIIQKQFTAHCTKHLQKESLKQSLEKPFHSSQDPWRLGLLILRQRTALLTNKMYD